MKAGNTLKQGLFAALGLVLMWAFVAPSNRADAFIYAGDSHLFEGHLELALTAYEDAVRAQPDSWRAHLRRAMALERLKRDPETTRLAYQRSLELDPEQPETLVRAGDFFIDIGELEKARVLARRHLAQKPGDFDGLYLMSKLLVAGGDVRLGARFMRKVLEINPYHAGAHLALARIEQHFDLPRAIESCRGVLGLGATPVERREAFLLLASLLQRAGQNREAAEALRAMLAAYPNSPEAVRARALLEELE